MRRSCTEFLIALSLRSRSRRSWNQGLERCRKHVNAADAGEGRPGRRGRIVGTERLGHHTRDQMSGPRIAGSIDGQEMRPGDAARLRQSGVLAARPVPGRVRHQSADSQICSGSRCPRWPHRAAAAPAADRHNLQPTCCHRPGSMCWRAERRSGDHRSSRRLRAARRCVACTAKRIQPIARHRHQQSRHNQDQRGDNSREGFDLHRTSTNQGPL